MSQSNISDLSRTQIVYLINEWIHNELDRALLERRLLDGITFEALAEEFDISTTQVKRRIYKTQSRLFKKI